MIRDDGEMLVAQQCVANLRSVLLAARRVHTAADYSRMSQPVLLEIQSRQQEILQYLNPERWQTAGASASRRAE